MKLHKTALVFVAAAIAGAASVVAIAASTSLFSSGEPSGSGAMLFPQHARSTADGITITLSGATFSGTETTIQASATIDGQPVVPGELTVPPGGFASPSFAGSTVLQSSGGNSTIVLQLPPVISPGEVQFQLKNLVVHSSAGGTQQRHGPWALTLSGPAASAFAATMRVEALQPSSVAIAGTTVAVTGRRSTSRTIIQYSVPSGLRELTPPRLVLSDGRQALPLGFTPTAAGVTATYPVTSFGSVVSVSFGPFSRPGDTGQTVSLGLTAALARAGATASQTNGEVAVLPGDVLNGTSDIALGFSIAQRRLDAGGGIPRNFGRRNPIGDITVLTVRLRGSWHQEDQDPENPSPYATTPGLLDAKGVRLRVLEIATGYSKSATGGIQEGETSVSFYVEPDTDLSRITLLLGSPSHVLGGSWVVQLKPA